MLCFSLFATASFGQQAYLDSLRLAFDAEKNPEKKIDIFYDIANEKAFDNPALQFAYADSLEVMSQKIGYRKGQAMALYLRGFARDDQGEYAEALELFRKELAIMVEIGDRKEQSTAYSNIGTAWSSMGRNDSAITYYLKAMEIDEELGERIGVSIHHNNIGSIYSDDAIYDKAIDHFEKALSIRQELGAEKRYAQCYSNLATVYGRMGDNAKAQEYGQQALDYALKYDNLSLAGIISNSIGSNLNDQGKYADAISWLEKALGNWKEIGNESYQTYALYNLSTAYAGLDDGKRALQHIQDGYEIVQRLGLEEQHELYYKGFAHAYEASGDIAKAYSWYQQYVTLVDSIFRLDNAEKVAKLEAQFETQKKEAQLTRQQLELERQAEQKRRILIGALIAFLILCVAFLLFRNRQKVRQQRAELEAQLKHVEMEKLREMDAVRSTFFANISHEFRTPLTLIISPIEQMIEGTLKGDYTKYYHIIHQNGRRLLRLVNQLLDLSKLESGKMKLHASEGDIGNAVRVISGSFESLAVRQDIDLDIRIPEEPVICYFDREKLEQILVNLISNAFKFTGEGGSVQISINVSGGETEISVLDNGIGISAERLPHLFERFTKSTMSEIQAGSGIGLALVKELAELHGGGIEVESEEDRGSRFKVTLETTKAFFKEDELVVNVPPGSAYEESGVQTTTYDPEVKQIMSDVLSENSRHTLLIAEDNKDMRTYIRETFQGMYRIVEAENGRIAFEKALEYTPDIIITDIMMPEMDGTELCRRLKADKSTDHIPVVMLTARADQADRLEGLDIGADDYLIKPFEAKELQVRVANLLTQRRLLHEHYRKTLSTFAATPAKAESMDARFLNSVREAIESQLENEDFNVVELSHHVGMSRSQLHRKLSALTGYSPNEVIRNMRLERARELLESQSGTVSEISYQCGFRSPAYFIKCFREYYDMTPGEIN